MKKFTGLFLTVIIAGSFLSANAALFSDEFAQNLLNCTVYTENNNSIDGYEKGKCIMQADYYTCRLSNAQVKEISRAIYTYNKKSADNFSPNAYKKLMMVFNRYVYNSKVCAPKYGTTFTKQKIK